MNKQFKIGFGIFFIILFNFGIFTLTKHPSHTFWVSWIFIHIAFIIAFLINAIIVPRKHIVYGYSISALSAFYFVIELVFGLFFIFILPSHTLLAFAIQIIALFAFFTVYLTAGGALERTEKTQVKSKADLRHFQYLLDCMHEVRTETPYTAPYKKLIEHTYDELASSPTATSMDVYDIEETISRLIFSLKLDVQNNNEAGISSTCTEIENLITKRNTILRQNNHH